MAGRFLTLALCIFSAYSLPVSQSNAISAIQPAISIPDTGVVNWPVVEAVAEKIQTILSNLKTRSSLTEAQIDEIINIANQIEGIVNIHSLEIEPDAQSSPTESQIDEIINIANKIEGIVNIHSLENAPKGGVINIPGFLDAIKSIIGSASVRSSLTVDQIDNIYNVLNRIEGIINIHSSEITPEAQSTDIENIINVLNKIEGIVNIH